MSFDFIFNRLTDAYGIIIKYNDKWRELRIVKRFIELDDLAELKLMSGEFSLRLEPISKNDFLESHLNRLSKSEKHKFKVEFKALYDMIDFRVEPLIMFERNLDQLEFGKIDFSKAYIIHEKIFWMWLSASSSFVKYDLVPTVNDENKIELTHRRLGELIGLYWLHPAHDNRHKTFPQMLDKYYDSIPHSLGARSKGDDEKIRQGYQAGKKGLIKNWKKLYNIDGPNSDTEALAKAIKKAHLKYKSKNKLY